MTLRGQFTVRQKVVKNLANELSQAGVVEFPDRSPSDPKVEWTKTLYDMTKYSSQ